MPLFCVQPYPHAFTRLFANGLRVTEVADQEFSDEARYSAGNESFVT